MKKYIVITTIYKPSLSTLKYCSQDEWEIVIVGDLKTPHEEYQQLEKEYKNVKYLHPNDQEKLFPELSQALGWNKIARRTIGFAYCYINNCDIMASVDDDNIPMDNWGKDIIVNKEITVYNYSNEGDFFDPLSVTEYKHLWHRGFPIKLIKNKNENTCSYNTVIPDIQANFWNGDPDIDAICRMEHRPHCIFDDKSFPFASFKFAPFNSQNTLINRKVLKYYCMLPGIGRMDDIWPSYYVQSLGFKVVYDKATVYQERNDHCLLTNYKDENIGVLNTINLVSDLKKNPNSFYDYLPEDSKKVLEEYLKITHEFDQKNRNNDVSK